MRSIQSRTCTVQPTAECVSLDEMKTFLKRDDSDDDALISLLITCARARCEAFLNRTLSISTFVMRLDGFPNNQALLSNRAFFGQLAPDGSLYIPAPPLQSITSIQYIDTNNVLQTLDPSQYVVDIYRQPARVALGVGVTAWPDTYEVVNAVLVTFIAGYDGTIFKLPETIRHAIKLMAAGWYEMRLPMSTIIHGDLPKILKLEDLLWTDRVVEFR